MATEKALIVTKGINWFPSNEEKCRGNMIFGGLFISFVTMVTK